MPDMEIIVKPLGLPAKYIKVSEQTTISELLPRVATEYAVDCDSITLLFKGTPLSDKGKTLQEFSIKHGDRVTVVVKPRHQIPVDFETVLNSYLLKSYERTAAQAIASKFMQRRDFRVRRSQLLFPRLTLCAFLSVGSEPGVGGTPRCGFGRASLQISIVMVEILVICCVDQGVWWNAKVRIRPSHPPAACLVSGLLDSVLTPGSGEGGGESVELLNLKQSASRGPDALSAKLLKEPTPEMSKPLALLFQASFATGCPPSNWNSDTITPPFKGRYRASANNYRPASLTSICCKVMEKIDKKALMQLIEQHHLLSDTRHNFVRRRPCVTNLLFLLERWTKTCNEGDVVHAIYIDIKKAFDSVPHQRLMHKQRNA
nr:unnamed protein product [Spirometra erinaceieuropaei]